MQAQQKISARRIKRKVGTRQQVIIDEVGPTVAKGRSMADAPEIDGTVYVASRRPLRVGEIATVKIERADAYDLHGTVVEERITHSAGATTAQGLTEAQLRGMIREAGFEPVRMTYFNFFLLPALALHRLWGRKGDGEEVRSDLWLPPKPINRLLESLLALECRLTSYHLIPVGSSLTTLARLPR
jgi:hypothetical protein